MSTQTQTEITQEFARNVLKSRQIVSQPGKYKAKIINEPTFLPADDDTGAPARHIVNTNLMTANSAKEAKNRFLEGEYAESINGTNLSGNVLGENPDWLPAKGEGVYVEVDYVWSRRQEKEVLGITAVTPMPVSQTQSGSSIFGDLDEDATQSSNGTVSEEEAETHNMTNE